MISSSSSRGTVSTSKATGHNSRVMTVLLPGASPSPVLAAPHLTLTLTLILALTLPLTLTLPLSLTRRSPRASAA